MREACKVSHASPVTAVDPRDITWTLPSAQAGQRSQPNIKPTCAPTVFDVRHPKAATQSLIWNPPRPTVSHLWTQPSHNVRRGPLRIQSLLDAANSSANRPEPELNRQTSFVDRYSGTHGAGY